MKKNTLRILGINVVLGLILTACGEGGGSNQQPTIKQSSQQPQQSVPILNPKNLNFIFVQSLEPNQNNNNLSIQGFNHSLKFGQLLNTITQSQVSAILTLDPWQQLTNGYPNMAPIQSIENFAVLTGSGIFPVLPTTVGNYYRPAAPSIAYYIETIIGQTSQIGVPSSGNFVIALPAEQINQTLAQLSQNSSLYFNYQPIAANNYNQYVVMSIDDVANITANTYNDGIVANNQYPNLNLNTTSACIESSITINVNSVPAVHNSNETIYLVRHVEAHPVATYDNGNYVCQGQWRAIGSVDRLQSIIGGLPNQVYSSDPNELDPYSCSIGSPYLPSESCPEYMRTSVTINPFVIKNGMQLGLVPESNFDYSNYESMARYFFQNNQFNNQTIVISWEHKLMGEMVNYLLGTIYGNSAAAAQVPNWAGEDYDTVWKIQVNSSGQITFSNTCEGIATASLPLSCPTF